MLHYKTSIAQTKILIISIIAISLAACGDETTNTQTETNSSPTSLTTSASPQATSTVDVTTLGVSNVGEINFTPASANPPGFFDTVNGSTAARVEFKKSTPVTVRGWAVLTNEGKTADKVIITYGDNNSVVAVAPVNLDRPDVVKALKNPNYSKSGWSATFDSSTLPTGTVALKAWAYNTANKNATQLANPREVIVSE